MIAQALRRRCATCEGAGEVTVNDTNPHGYGPDPQCDEDVPCPVTDCIDGWVPVEGATLYLEGPGKATLELDVDADGMIADARPGRAASGWAPSWSAPSGWRSATRCARAGRAPPPRPSNGA